MTLEDFEKILSRIIEQYKFYSKTTWRELPSHPFGLRSMYKQDDIRFQLLSTGGGVENGIYTFCSIIYDMIVTCQQNNQRLPYPNDSCRNDFVGQLGHIALRVIHLEDFEIPEKHRMYYEIEMINQNIVYIGGHSTNCSGSGKEGSRTLDFVFHSLAYLLNNTVHHVILQKEKVDIWRKRSNNRL